MREFVLNDACLGGALSLEAAAIIAADVETGIAALIAASHGVNTMRLTASAHEVQVAAGVSLLDVFHHLLRHGSAGRLLARMATKYPVEDDLDDGEFEALVNWQIPTHPGSIPLVLCAKSGRIAATISEDAAWKVDPLELEVAQNPAEPGETVSVAIDNVYSAANATALSKRLDAAFVRMAGPADIWRDRARLYPNLDFAPRVERDLANLKAVQYGLALKRLDELNRASGDWAAPAPKPGYLSKVTGESKQTMKQYGGERVFRSSSGSDETFELHARLPDGFRLHFREILANHRIEVGYVGPHLSIVSED